LEIRRANYKMSLEKERKSELRGKTPGMMAQAAPLAVK